MPKEIRIKLSLRSPNPLFEKWLENWMFTAEQQNLMKKHSLRKALDSLRKYPLVLHSGRDCAILEGFGPNICQNLDKQLAVFKAKQHVFTEEEHQDSIKEVIDKVQEILTKEEKLVKKKTNSSKEDQISNIFKKYDYVNDLLLDEKNEPELPSTQTEVKIPPNSFEIILLVDTAETIG